MVVTLKSEGCDGKTSRKYLLFTSSLGVMFMLIPVSFLFVNPLIIGAKYYLRVANGSIIHQLMTQRVDGPKIYLSLFNVTNPQEFLSGKHDRMRVEEVGPFVYQEYRINHDFHIDEEKGVMTYTPELWSEFIPEESCGDPKQMYVTMPSTPMLSGAAMMEKYNFFVRNLFNMLSASVHSKALVNRTVHEYLWGYDEPLLRLMNTVVPGLIYYNSSGIMSRLFDTGASYTMEVGTASREKFSVKRVMKLRAEQNVTEGVKLDLVESVQTFPESYEGAVFPPGLSPDKPLSIFRHSVCRVFPFSYVGTAVTQYGSEGFVYDLANTTMNEHMLCDKGWCPDGLIDIAPCYNNFPFALSRGHFLNADPRVFNKIEGLKPDPKLHSSRMVIDPRLGVTLSASISIQLNIFVGDVGFNKETSRFKNMVVPICQSVLTHPRLPPQADIAFRIIYIYGPYILGSATVFCCLLGLLLLGYSLRQMCSNWSDSKIRVFDTNSNVSHLYIPLKLR